MGKAGVDNYIGCEAERRAGASAVVLQNGCVFTAFYGTQFYFVVKLELITRQTLQSSKDL